MEAGQQKQGAAGTILTFLRTLAPAARRRLLLLTGATGAGLLAELATIGAVVPFLALLADPAQAAELPGWSLFVAITGGGSHQEVAVEATLLLIATAIAAAITRLVIMHLSFSFVTMTAHEIGCAIFARTLRRPYRRHVEGNSAELLGSVEKLQLTVGSALMPLVQVPVAVAMVVAIGALLLAMDPVAAGAGMILFTLFYFLVGSLLRRRLRRGSSTLSQVATQRMKTLQETMGSIRDIILEDTQPIFEEEYRRLDLRFRLAQRRGMFAGAAPRFLAEAMGIVLIGLLALYMAGEEGSLGPALPLLGALALGAQRMLPLMQQIYHGVTTINANLFLLQDVAGMLRAPIVEPEAERPAPLPFEHAIEVERVAFRFGSERDWALRDISLTIPAGARIAVTGRTGSGKSSFFDLLMGLLDPDAGEIRIDGVLLDAGTRAAWRRRIAHVPQAVYLLDRSVAANIAFGAADGEIDMARVEGAARRAQIHALVETLADGYDTPIGERGIRLSGGERQRIAIARALYRGARVLILDEATAALDEATETAVVDAICAGDPKLTILAATHRVSTLERFDRVLTFEEGRLVSDVPNRTSPEGVLQPAFRAAPNLGK